MAPSPFQHVLTDVDDLESVYGAPSALVQSKKVDHVDEGAASLIAASPLVMLATTDAQGRCTVSPRGGAPGFVRVLDPHRLAIADANGNRLMDSARNLLVNPHVGMLFVQPGQTWTLRVAGRAWVTRDPEVTGGARLGIGVEVETVFVHCGQAFRFGSVWDPESWGGPDAVDPRHVIRGHLAINGSDVPPIDYD